MVFLIFFLKFFNFLIFFNLKKKLKMPRVKSLCVTCGIVSATWHYMPRVSVTIRCHCVDFDLVLIYVFLFQFST